MLITNLKPKSRNVRVASIICTNITLEVSRVMLTQWRVQGLRGLGEGVEVCFGTISIKIKVSYEFRAKRAKKRLHLAFGA